jgi:uncharacterized lipoprotein YajG
MVRPFITWDACMKPVAILAALLLLAACAADSIEDRRYGQQVVCHDGEKTLAVSNADSFVHLGHGDAAGPCSADDS